MRCRARRTPRRRLAMRRRTRPTPPVRRSTTPPNRRRAPSAPTRRLRTSPHRAEPGSAGVTMSDVRAARARARARARFGPLLLCALLLCAAPLAGCGDSEEERIADLTKELKTLREGL